VQALLRPQRPARVGFLGPLWPRLAPSGTTLGRVSGVFDAHLLRTPPVSLLFHTRPSPNPPALKLAQQRRRCHVFERFALFCSNGPRTSRFRLSVGILPSHGRTEGPAGPHVARTSKTRSFSAENANFNQKRGPKSTLRPAAHPQPGASSLSVFTAPSLAPLHRRREEGCQGQNDRFREEKHARAQIQASHGSRIRRSRAFATFRKNCRIHRAAALCVEKSHSQARPPVSRFGAFASYGRQRARTCPPELRNRAQTRFAAWARPGLELGLRRRPRKNGNPDTFRAARGGGKKLRNFFLCVYMCLSPGTSRRLRPRPAVHTRRATPAGTAPRSPALRTPTPPPGHSK
jgi:hypothetical protein